jgi:radical SAM protein with 4Fe4S-binding SPASM domain
VVSCAYCTDIPIGNIRTNSLEKIWHSQQMQNIKNIRVCDVKECRECPMRNVCGTGCRINAYFLHKDFLNAKDDYACAAIKFFIEEVKPLLKKYDIISLI